MIINLSEREREIIVRGLAWMLSDPWKEEDGVTREEIIKLSNKIG